jgi:hypothetical protein
MASIRRRNGRYHVQIRKNGYQTLTHTLSSLSLARKWAAGVEADMERCSPSALVGQNGLIV